MPGQQGRGEGLPRRIGSGNRRGSHSRTSTCASGWIQQLRAERLPGTLLTRSGDGAGSHGRLVPVWGNAVCLGGQGVKLGKPHPGRRNDTQSSQPRRDRRPVGAPTGSEPRATASDRGGGAGTASSNESSLESDISPKATKKQQVQPTRHTVAITHLIAWIN